MLDIIAQADPNGVIDALDILTAVEGYYQNAFNQLTWVLVIGLMVVGVVVPSVINFFQSRSFKKSENRFKADIDGAKADIDVLKVSLAEQIADETKRLKDEIKALEDRQEKALAKEACMFRLNLAGSMSTNTSQEYVRIGNYVSALYHAFIGDDKSLFEFALGGIEGCISGQLTGVSWLTGSLPQLLLGMNKETISKLSANWLISLENAQKQVGRKKGWEEFTVRLKRAHEDVVKIKARFES